LLVCTKNMLREFIRLLGAVRLDCRCALVAEWVTCIWYGVP